MKQGEFFITAPGSCTIATRAGEDSLMAVAVDVVDREAEANATHVFQNAGEAQEEGGGIPGLGLEVSFLVFVAVAFALARRRRGL